MNHLEVSFISIFEVPWRERAVTYCLGILDYLKRDNCEISLVFTDDVNIAELNRRYRKQDEPTDVLAFCRGEEGDFPSGAKSPVQHLGDIVISLDMVERHSEEFKVSLDEELRRVLVHGILHLTGWRHKTRKPSEPMLQCQEEIIQVIGESIL